MKCTDCRHGLHHDTGYSSYTVEGTDFFCLISKHPSDGFDVWYDRDARLDYANECLAFEAGQGISMDVDRGDYADLSPSDKERFKAWAGDGAWGLAEGGER